MPVKTKEIKSILEPIQTQVNKLLKLIKNNSSIKSDVFPSKSILVEQLQGLAEKFEDLSKEDVSDYQELKTKITDTVEKFCLLEYNTDSIDTIDGQVLENVATSFLSKFLTALESLEKLECLPLKQNLLDCWEYVKEMGIANEIEHIQNIKELGMSILEMLQPLQRYRKSLVSQLLSDRIILYTCQMCATFKLLVQLVEEQHRLNLPIYNCKKYTCNRLCTCIHMIVNVLNAPNPSVKEENYERENHFVYRMDLALDIIAEMPGQTQEQQAAECEELWSRIEDVFSHAMAIAQICNPHYFKAIVGACQSIMTEYDNLKLQLSSQTPDTALNNLFMNTLTDALYRLERKINISVLNLVLEVFGDPFSALRKLVMICGNSLNAKIRSKNDLNSAIEDFDQILDKSIQIGLFAIASCNNVNKINQIRNALAGLEALETELVSAVTAFYLRPDSKEMRANVKILTAQWQGEINKLHQAVDLVIDSAAYCEIVLDEIQERVSTMSNCLDNREPVTQIQVQGVVQRALSLSRQVSAVFNDIGIDTIERQTIMMVRELKAAIYEADVAAKTLLTENPTEPQQLRVIKRCELILNVIKRLQPALVIVINNSTTFTVSYSTNRKGQDYTTNESTVKKVAGCKTFHNEKTFIRTPYTVRHYKSPLSIQPANSIPRSESCISCLMPYIKKGREMRTERSIMYKTPKKCSSRYPLPDTEKSNLRKLSNIRQHLFSRSSVDSFQETCLSEESIDLTDILEKFATSSNTFKTLQSSTTVKNTSEYDTTKIVAQTLANIPETLIRSIGTSGSIKSSRAQESSAIGGGDGLPIVESSKKSKAITF